MAGEQDHAWHGTRSVAMEAPWNVLTGITAKGGAR